MAYGTVNADVIGTSVAGSNIGAGNASIMKNRIINGAMVIDQRNAGASVTPANNDFGVDRFKYQLTQSGKVTSQQNAGSVTPPVGFSNYLGVTSTSAYSVVATDQFCVSQYIEGFNTADLQWGTANAKTVTVSAWVRSSLTGTFSGVIQNSAQDRCYPFVYTISAANTWQQISVTIAGDTSGTWIGATNGTGLRLIFSFGNGSTYAATAGAWTSQQYTTAATGTTSVVGTSGATFYITGVQLEVGSSATGFEYRQYQQELALCQRYYWKWIPTSASSYLATTMNFNTVTCYAPIKLPITMRATPTLTTSGTASDYGGYSASTRFTLSSIPAIDISNYDTPNVSFSVASGLTAGYAGIFGSNTTNGYLGFNAEL
jgi:hypothetical protein